MWKDKSGWTRDGLGGTEEDLELRGVLQLSAGGNGRAS